MRYKVCLSLDRWWLWWEVPAHHFPSGKQQFAFRSLASVRQGSLRWGRNLKDETGHVLKPRQTGKGGITKGMT